MNITKKEENWIKEAGKKGLSRLAVKRKLERIGGKYDENKIEEMLNFYGKLNVETIEEKQEKEEEEFKGEYMEYLELKEKRSGKLGFRERLKYKDCIRFEKNISKLLEIMKVTLKGVRKELVEMGKKFSKNEEKYNKETNDLKIELIDNLMLTKGVLEIDNPKTGKEATKDNLMECNINELLNLFEENVESLGRQINGKLDQDRKDNQLNKNGGNK